MLFQLLDTVFLWLLAICYVSIIERGFLFLPYISSCHTVFLDSAYRLLDTACGLLDTAYRFLDTAYRLLDTAYRLLDTAYRF